MTADAFFALFWLVVAVGWGVAGFVWIECAGATVGAAIGAVAAAAAHYRLS